MNRKIPLVNSEYYHIYNRGVDKRNLFEDVNDLLRFFKDMKEFNVVKPIGSLYEKSILKNKNNSPASTALVEFIAYCVNPNHYHFLLRQVADGGISEFMKRLNGGYTWYFNNKHKRNGALFQGKFKSVHISSNEYLLHLSSYINLNNYVHGYGGPTAILSSWNEYIGKNKSQNKKEKIENFCNKDIILGQFSNIEEYKKFARSSLQGILDRRGKDQEILNLLIE